MRYVIFMFVKTVRRDESRWETRPSKTLFLLQGFQNRTLVLLASSVGVKKGRKSHTVMHFRFNTKRRAKDRINIARTEFGTRYTRRKALSTQIEIKQHYRTLKNKLAPHAALIIVHAMYIREADIAVAGRFTNPAKVRNLCSRLCVSFANIRI